LIFLTVGTWHNGYDRLVEAIDQLLNNSVISEEVVGQIGYSSYKPKHMIVMDFCSPDEFISMVSKARILISHAGMGTIIEAVKQAKPIIVVPRKPELGEVDNDHQFATARQLEEEGKILVAYEVDNLPEKIEQAKTFVPAQGQGNLGIINAVQVFIDDLVRRKGS